MDTTTQRNYDNKNINNLRLSKLAAIVLEHALENEGGVTIAYLSEILKKSKDKEFNTLSKNTLKVKIFRELKKLQELKLIEKNAYNSKIVFYKIKSSKNIISLLEKLSLQQNSNSCNDFSNNSYKRKIKLLNAVKRAEKVFLNERQMNILHTTKSTMLNEELKERIIENFIEHIKHTKKRYILLCNLYDLEEKELSADSFKVLKASNRFTKDNYFKQQNKRIKSFFYLMSKKYKHAVHLTLTFDPKRHKNNYLLVARAMQHVNRILQNYRQIIKRRQNRKLNYIKFTEYTESGLIHFHIILFGVRYLRKAEEIYKSQWKQGWIHIYQLINTKRGWTYPKGKPKDYNEKIRRKSAFKEKSALAYFYFTYDENAEYEELDSYSLLNYALHFTHNTRFFTTSRLPKSSASDEAELLDLLEENKTELYKFKVIMYSDISKITSYLYKFLDSQEIRLLLRLS